MLPRALLLLGAPLLAACPSLAYGPEAYEVIADPQDCQTAGLASDCSRFVLENGDIYTGPNPQPVSLSLGFEANYHNLADLVLEYEIPGRSPVRVVCSLEESDASTGTGTDTGTDTGSDTGSDTGDTDTEAAPETVESELACAVPNLEAARPTSSARGVLEIEAFILAEQAGSYAISAWLTDTRGFDSPVVRWQFPVLDPVRLEPGQPSE